MEVSLIFQYSPSNEMSYHGNELPLNLRTIQVELKLCTVSEWGIKFAVMCEMSIGQWRSVAKNESASRVVGWIQSKPASNVLTMADGEVAKFLCLPQCQSWPKTPLLLLSPLASKLASTLLITLSLASLPVGTFTHLVSHLKWVSVEIDINSHHKGTCARMA
jgi:hypothetical protein